MARYEIHVSELKTFLRCRRQFEWSSLLKKGLEPKRPHWPFYMGRGIHEALRRYYDTGQLPQDAFDEWAAVEDAKIEESLSTRWDEEIAAELAEQRELAHGMLEHYSQWAPARDRHLEFIATELEFKLPLPSPSGRPSSRVCVAGRFDGLVYDTRTRLVWIFETKTTAQGAASHDWLQNDLQAGLYVWAAQQIYGRDVAGVLYNFLLKKVPRMPARLKRGGFSRAQNALAATTYEVLRDGLATEARSKLNYTGPELHYKPTPEELEAMTDQQIDYWLLRKELFVDYYDELKMLAARGNHYFWRNEVLRTSAEIRELIKQIHYIGLEMVRPSTPMYPSPDFFGCRQCLFRNPCLLKSAGGDETYVLESSYRPRQRWDETDGVVVNV